MKRAICTDRAPAAIGPYSQAIRINGLLFTSGQIPIDPATNRIVTGNVKAQTRQVLKNLEAILAEAGTSFEHVVKTTVFLNDMHDFADVNEVYAEFFPTPAPARSCVAVVSLPKDVKVEIEVVAALAD
ncbi:MAG TPA: RidA family protein [Firmicutes bacterium]|nr:RidA family protein [Bacillota bacterium]